MNVRLAVEYEGSAFHGFQVQPGLRTVQGELEEAVARLTGERSRVIGAGRTDAGVHAAGQVVNFHTATRLTPAEVWRALNALLPADIAVHAAEEVPAGFHARFSARSRRYRYWVLNGKVRSALLRRYVHFEPRPLRVEAMAEACQLLLGRQDFASFAGMSQGVPGKVGEGTVRTVLLARLDWLEQNALPGARDPVVEFEVEADAFLPQMVRNMVGTLLKVGMAKLDTEGFRQVLLARDRRMAGPTAPAHGLCLIRVNY